jgi:hypothetical protein
LSSGTADEDGNNKLDQADNNCKINTTFIIIQKKLDSCIPYRSLPMAGYTPLNLAKIIAVACSGQPVFSARPGIAFCILNRFNIFLC